MKKKFIIVILYLILIPLTSTIIFGQLPSNLNKYRPTKQNIVSTYYKIYKPERLKEVTPGRYSKADWAEIIDSTWGPGMPTEEKLVIFDRAWNYLDRGYGAFVNYDVNMDSLRDLYRSEIASGVSRGRFAAIMNYLAYALKDAHTLIDYLPVNYFTDLQPGIPIFVTGACVDVSHFGAGLTPLPDSTLLVYNALPNHTLGLQLGDIVLGYDGIPWKQLYKQLLDAQLPLRNTQIGSNDESALHISLQSAGLNWHLFDTIDVIKYNSGDTVHLPTSLLQNQTGNIWGNEQMPTAGVPFPDVYNNDFVSWGIVEGTTIGYIYVWAWFMGTDISEQFYDAVYNLMFDYKTTGLILDFRVNYGGDMRVAHAGYSLLFNQTIRKIAFDNRGNPNDHLDMVPSTTHPTNLWVIHPDTSTFYDKPITVLIGPNAFSNGDWESVRMQFHPMARSFGKSTNGAFTISDMPNLGNSDFMFSRATGSGYLIDGHEYMAHRSAEVDERIWLTREDVANGYDTVVKRAIQWINNSSYAHDVTKDKPSYLDQDTVRLRAFVQNPLAHPITVTAYYELNGVTIDSSFFKDDGLHSDSAAGDGIWGTLWQPTSQGYYHVHIKTYDPIDGSSFTLPSIVRFSSFLCILGDADNSGSIDISDVIYLINYLFRGGPAPEPMMLGDCNNDTKVSVSDVVYLINYLLKGGPKPEC